MTDPSPTQVEIDALVARLQKHSTYAGDYALIGEEDPDIRAAINIIVSLQGELARATTEYEKTCDDWKAQLNRASKAEALSTDQPRGERCEVCGQEVTFVHDHRPDLSGLDDGPPLRPVRKKPPVKGIEETADIRARAWATRRERYGKAGHR